MSHTYARRSRTIVHDRRAAFARALTLAVLLATPGLAVACDLCAIYTTTEERQDRTGLLLGVGEQYTYFATLKDNGQTVPNPAGERLRSSITQIVIGYNFHPRIGLQVNLPIIDRTFRRLQPSGIMNGNETGFGDMSVVATGKLLSWFETDFVAHIIVLGGLKFPTGNPDALGEELTEDQPCIPFPDPTQCHIRGTFRLPPDVQPHHTVGGVQSGIHGHDIALGSGSVDGILGAQVFGGWKRLYATAAIQYLARTVGAFGYQYANDLLFETGPGAYLFLGDNLFGAPYSFGAQVLFSGETKGNDTLKGEDTGDTAVTALYLGPAFRFGWGDNLGAEITAQLPVLQHNTQLQILPDYRLLGGITWRF